MSELSVFAQVVLVDILFAGDNAIAVGLVAAGLPKEQRSKVIAVGVGLAVVIRIMFAAVTVQLLKVPGLLLVGGLLLLWVCWRLYVDMKRHSEPSDSVSPEGVTQTLTFKQALIQILAADISMSLDNVLAVAGIARDHLVILVFGLVLSVVLMLVAATYIAKLLQKHRWLAYVGILVILVVAGSMLWEGSHEIYYIFFA